MLGLDNKNAIKSPFNFFVENLYLKLDMISSKTLIEIE